MKVLFIDTETTGLPQDPTQSYLKPGNYPRMVQLAYKLYTWTQARQLLIMGENTYVVPTFDIPENAINFHGITTEMATEKGKELSECLIKLSKALKLADVIVCHDADFKGGVIGQEFFISLGIDVMNTHWHKLFCTRKYGRGICKIPLSSNEMVYKFPSLRELYIFHVGKPYKNDHNVLHDVNALLRCFPLFFLYCFNSVDSGVVQIS